ncbi:hypothetical protein EBU99_14290 [bacterium]|nr:hypothetical protein [bacterium]
MNTTLLKDDVFVEKLSEAAYDERWRETQELLERFKRMWANGTNSSLMNITLIQKEDGCDDHLFELMEPHVLKDVCGPRCNLTAYGRGTVEDLVMGEVDGERIVAAVRLVSVSEHEVVLRMNCRPRAEEEKAR